jgi:2-keto-4-pentenoate hydratase/2-oxohepta-3-ene-1,7-dioic acid hydratase in catechol pathway
MSGPAPRPAGLAWFAHRRRGVRHLGIVEPRGEALRWVDLGPRAELELLASGGLDATALLTLSRDATELDGEPEFAVPVARPGKILCLGKNFAAHAAEFGAAVPEEPIFFTKLVDALSPHGAPVVLPHWLDTRIDHEVELGVVLGFADPERRGRKYVRAEHALELVAGYTVVNDVTARKMQGTDRDAKKPWLRCKSFDTFCPIGPWVVPRENAPRVADAGIRLWVGEALRQESRTSLMVVDVAHAIEYLSRHTTLRPGDLIAMGTPEGVGPIADGDRMVAEIDGIGRLANPVVRERAPNAS